MFFRINKEFIPLKLTMTSSLWLRFLFAFLFCPWLKALDMGLWFKLASSISLLSLFFFLIELFCSVRSVVCLYFIFLFCPLSCCCLFFLLLPENLLKKGENNTENLAWDSKVGESVVATLWQIALSFEVFHSLELHLITPWKLLPHVPIYAGRAMHVRPWDGKK